MTDEDLEALFMTSSDGLRAVFEAGVRVGASPKARAPKAAVRNKRLGALSKSSPGLKLPAQRRQACGHVFNSAGSGACLACIEERAEARGWRAKLVCEPVEGVADRIAKRIQNLLEAERAGAMRKAA